MFFEENIVADARIMLKKGKTAKESGKH